MKNLEELWSRIGSVPKEEVVRAVLRDEIENALHHHSHEHSGHLPYPYHDYISRLNSRLEELG